jgi:hypothetical protein
MKNSVEFANKKIKELEEKPVRMSQPSNIPSPEDAKKKLDKITGSQALIWAEKRKVPGGKRVED